MQTIKRKQPEELEAFQYNSREDVPEILKWMTDKLGQKPETYFDEDIVLEIDCPKYTLYVGRGDWIYIQHGEEFYVMTSAIFEAEFELVE